MGFVSSRLMLFVVRCALCREIGPSPCHDCAGKLSPPPDLPIPPNLADVISLFAYEDHGRQLLTATKYRNQRGAVHWIAQGLARQLQAREGSGNTLITWIPGSFQGRWTRGYDLSELLARSIARALQAPIQQILKRAEIGMQSSRNAEDRHKGPRFKATPTWRMTHAASIILVDDVLTTGSSMSAAAKAIASANGQSAEHSSNIIGVTAARTPLREGAR